MALLHHAHERRTAHRVSTLAVSGGPQGSQASAPAVQPQQQLEEYKKQQQQQAFEQQQPHSSSWYKSHFDMNLWHYLPW